MAESTHKFQAPRGTRDFYPAEMAVRRHIESIWRDVSINHGFEEIDGPTFEHLELYTAKSGEGIVSELFSFQREGGDTAYALRPEFTPTLARMYAARAAQMPKPVKWFCVPSFFRAERPQRGRLREFFQWNADIIGDDSPRADAEVIALTVGILERMGFTSDDVVVKLSHREAISKILIDLGVDEPKHPAVFSLLDRKDKISSDEFTRRADEIGFNQDQRDRFAVLTDKSVGRDEIREKAAEIGVSPDHFVSIAYVEDYVTQLVGRGDWVRCDLSIVRGLAYYTGTVFEVHAKTGTERAIAGGGRYDKLVELFGGPSTPAVGIAMGDVVIRLMLEDRGLLEEAEAYLPRPDAFVISALDDGGKAMGGLIAELRRAGLHARHSYKATKNVGKLLGDAGKARARCAVIIGAEWEQGKVAIKDLETKEQTGVEAAELVEHVRSLVRAQQEQE